MHSYEHLQITKRSNPIPHICIFLNKPQLHNAFNEHLISELTECFEEANEDNKSKAIVLGGHGRSFCAGADLEWMKKSADFTYEENLTDARSLSDLFAAINKSKKPVIGRIHGAAIGGGTGLVAVCDMAVATERATFAFSEVNLGIIPAVISPYVLAKIGIANARELFLTGQRFSATHALQIGLIQYVVTEKEIDTKISELLSTLRSSGPHAVAACKELIQRVVLLTGDEARNYTTQFIAKLRTSKEGQEGIISFLEKRKANWMID